MTNAPVAKNKAQTEMFKALVTRLVFAGPAFCVGWIVYMIAMMLTTYDGFPSLIFQPIMAALCSGIGVALSLFVGLVFRIPIVGRWWNRSQWLALVLAFACLALLVFGSALGLTSIGIHPETGSEVVGLDPLAAGVGYFGLIFVIANWPTRSLLRFITARASNSNTER